MNLYQTAYRVIGEDKLLSTPHQDNSIEIIQTWSDGGHFIVKNKVFPFQIHQDKSLWHHRFFHDSQFEFSFFLLHQFLLLKHRLVDFSFKTKNPIR